MSVHVSYHCRNRRQDSTSAKPGSRRHYFGLKKSTNQKSLLRLFLRRRRHRLPIGKGKAIAATTTTTTKSCRRSNNVNVTVVCQMFPRHGRTPIQTSFVNIKTYNIVAPKLDVHVGNSWTSMHGRSYVSCTPIRHSCTARSESVCSAGWRLRRHGRLNKTLPNRKSWNGRSHCRTITSDNSTPGARVYQLSASSLPTISSTSRRLARRRLLLQRQLLPVPARFVPWYLERTLFYPELGVISGVDTSRPEKGRCPLHRIRQRFCVMRTSWHSYHHT
mmetsp:Transcript_62873/g.153088  ORF Transcript_62873/g.153088 Transcript_62873/m.153088 type:complete len:275 (+) Transcript_62873:996-1820(+)